MKVFVTGLCLQGNKGGPAIALSLHAQLRRLLPDIEFVHSVPGGDQWSHEERWGAVYGIDVVADASHTATIRGLLGSRDPRDAAARRWVETLRRCDAVIEMSAISYVSPPAMPLRRTLTRSRARYFAWSRLLRKPMLAWTQSYGPFDHPAVAALARRDLLGQEFIFCRGDACLEAVRQLVPERPAAAFPDVACTLPYDRDAGRRFLRRSGVTSRRVVTISPSAVLYRSAPGVDMANRHVIRTRHLVRRLADLGYRPVLLPHTLFVEGHGPEGCDREVCRLVADGLEQATVIEDDLSPIGLKSIIANATMHVGARYHSVVAGLSAGVPTLSLAWHMKYRDIMTFFGVQEHVLGSAAQHDPEDLIECAERLLAERSNVRGRLRRALPGVEAAVERNAEIFAGLLSRACP